MGSRPRIPLPARSVRDAVCEAMGPAVPEGFRPQAPTLPTLAAGADEPESVAVDRVAADAAVFDTDTATSYRDGVESQDLEDTSWLERGERSRERWRKLGIRQLGVPYIESDRERAKYAEHVRRSRLARWQRQP